MYILRAKHHRLTDLLLVLAIALAPLQGVFSAYDDSCEHEDETVVTDVGSYAAVGDEGSDDHSGPNSAQSCCQHDCSSSGCADACLLIHASPCVISTSLVFLDDNFYTYDAQLVLFEFGQPVSTLFRPPRTPV